MVKITLTTLGDWEIGENIIPFDFGGVFNLLDINGEVGFCKLETLSWSLDVGVFITLLSQAILPL